MKALGIDIGTTTISAVIADESSREVIESFTIANTSFIETKMFWESLQDPAVIIGKACGLLEDIMDRHKDICVIGLTGQMHGIVYTDRDGKHVSPLYTWQDGRGNRKCQEDESGNQRYQGDGRSACEIIEEAGGMKIHTGYGMATHFYNHMAGQVPEQAASLCTIADYLGMVLTGRKKPLVHAGNAASLGLYDVKENRFREDILDRLGLDVRILPEVTEKFQIPGTYQGIPVCVAVGDNQSSFLGSVRNARESILVNMGTGGQVSVYSSQYFTAEDIEARPFINSSYLPVGSSLCGGRAYALLAQFFGQCARAMGAEGKDPYEMMERFLAENDKDDKEKKNSKKGDLLVDTRFSGTREHPEWRGGIHNIGTDNFTPQALTAGFLNGMAEELYQMYRRMGNAAVEGKKRMIASGNGLRKNRYLRDIMSRRFSMPLSLAAQKEEAAYGAALSGLIGTERLTVYEAVGI